MKSKLLVVNLFLACTLVCGLSGCPKDEEELEGCVARPDLVGQWLLVEGDESYTEEETYTFNSDGTGTEYQVYSENGGDVEESTEDLFWCADETVLEITETDSPDDPFGMTYVVYEDRLYWDEAYIRESSEGNRWIQEGYEGEGDGVLDTWVLSIDISDDVFTLIYDVNGEAETRLVGDVVWSPTGFVVTVTEANDGDPYVGDAVAGCHYNDKAFLWFSTQFTEEELGGELDCNDQGMVAL